MILRAMAFAAAPAVVLTDERQNPSIYRSIPPRKNLAVVMSMADGAAGN